MNESLEYDNTVKEELLLLMRRQFFSPRRSLGQNFLIDSKVFDKIIKQLDPDKRDALVEIGMGPGLLSRELALKAGMYLGCEIDQRFEVFHSEIFHGMDLNVQILYGDALNIDFSTYANEFAAYDRLLVFSNLPYYITTDLILKLILCLPQADLMLFMVEKAALGRILARPASKAYGALAIISSLWGKWKEVMTVSASSFEPAPHTTSSLYVLMANSESQYKKAASDAAFQGFTAALLRNRRKTLVNALMYTKIQEERLVRKRLDAFLKKEDLPFGIRAESLTAHQFVRLFAILVNETDVS